MVAIVVGTAVTVLLAVAIFVFVAFPGRGRAIPGAQWLNGAVDRAVRKLPEDVSEEFLPARR
jgi:hypothetical protein